jgi:hypothetical protein
MEEDIVSVQSSPLRAKPITSHLHEGIETSFEMGTKARNQDNSVLGRPVNYRQDIPTNKYLYGNGMSKNDPVRMVTKFQKIITNACSTDITFRDEYRHREDDRFGTGEENSQYTANGLPNPASIIGNLDKTGTVHRNGPRYSTGESASSFSNPSFIESTEYLAVSPLNPYYSGHEEGPGLVGNSVDEMEWTTPFTATTCYSGLYGRRRLGVWDRLEHETYSWDLVQGGVDAPYQRQGATRHRKDISPYLHTGEPPSTAMYGQHGSHSSYQKIWRNTVGRTEPDSPEDLAILFCKLNTAINSLRAIETEPSRCTIASTVATDRMATTSSLVSTTGSTMGTTLDRPICFANDQSTTAICNMGLSSDGIVDQCIQPGLEPSTRTTFPSPSLELNYSYSGSDVDQQQQGSNVHNTQLAIRSVVPDAVTVDTPTSDGTSTPRRSQGTKRSYSEEECVMVSAGVDDQPHPDKKLRWSNNKQIKQQQQKFANWLQDQEEDDSPISMKLILEFIQGNSWSFNTSCQYIHRIIQMYPSQTRYELQKDDAYKSFLQDGKRNTLRPFKHYHYNIQPALQHLISMGTNSTLSPTDLTAKLAWLLSMAGFFRPSDLARVDIDKSTFTTGNILHLVVICPKERRRGQPIWRSVAIHPHDNPLLCPVQLYKDYCSRVANTPCIVSHPTMPNTTLNALVRSVKQPSKALTPERISKYVKQIMTQVERSDPTAPIPKARALGATLAALNGISVDQILAHGNWSSRAIFEDFYRISVSNNTNFTNSTLEIPQSSSSKCNVM